MRGLGSSIYPDSIAYDLFDEVHWVAAPEALWAARGPARTRYATGGWEHLTPPAPQPAAA